MQSAASVSVIISGGDLGTRLLEIVGSLDAQTLPYARYQVIFVDPGSNDRTSARLAELATGRPNLTVLAGAAGSDPLVTGLQAATGEYVLQLGRHDRLQSFALERLLDHAADKDADLVLARSAGTGPIGYLPDLGLADWKADADEAAVGMLAPCALIRREVLTRAIGGEPIDGATGWRTVRLGVLAEVIRSGHTIAHYADTPVSTGPGPAQEETAQDAWTDAAAAARLIGDRPAAAARFVAAHVFSILRRSGATADPALGDRLREAAARYCAGIGIEQLPPAQHPVLDALLGGDLSAAVTAARAWGRIAPVGVSTQTQWMDGRLSVTVQGRLDLVDDKATADLDESSLQLALRSVGSPVEYRLHTDTALERGNGSLAFTVSAAVDPMTAAAGAALDRGRWQFLLRVHGLGVDTSVREAIPYATTSGAIVEGEPIALYQHNAQLRLDVSSRSSTFVGRCTPADAAITESAAGSLLTIRLPEVAVRGDADLPGHLLLDSFPLPGALRVSDGVARIECFVSGLAGVSKLSARFGPAAVQDLGLQLRINGSGDMAIEKPSPRPTSKPAKKPAQTAGKAAETSGRTPQRTRAAEKAPKPGGRSGRKSAAKPRTLTSKLPPAVRPVARRAARIPAIRNAYRSLKKLAS